MAGGRPDRGSCMPTDLPATVPAGVLPPELVEVLRAFLSRGDLAHLALVLWAGCTTALLAWSLRELAATNRRFNEVVQALLRLAQRF